MKTSACPSVRNQISPMVNDHPNVLLLSRLDLCNLAAAPDLFTCDFTWHFFNPKFPAIQGDYFGLEGLQSYFKEIEALTGGSFPEMPISVMPMGDELTVAHIQDTTTVRGQPIPIDAVIVWRIVNGRIAEAWVITSGYTMALAEATDERRPCER